MKYLFKSDYFDLIHPSKSPRKMSEWSVDELAEAQQNTKTLTLDANLLKKAKTSPKHSIPKGQDGSVIIFPEVTDDRVKIMKSFIGETFGKTVRELKGEYAERTDPIDFCETSDDGRNFGGETVNELTGEKFSRKSVAFYIAGCKDLTADWLFEEAIDRCYSESSKADRRFKREKKDIRIGFEDFRTFLVYSGGQRRFYQMGSHENELYSKTRVERKNFNAAVYDVVGLGGEPHNPLTEGMEFE